MASGHHTTGVDATAAGRRLTGRDPWFGEPASADAEAAARDFLAEAAKDLERPVVTAGLSGWKRRTLAPFLAADAKRVEHRPTLAAAIEQARAIGAVVAVWGNDVGRDLPPDAGVPLIRMEDGFIRSVGLGLKRVPPLSLVVDGDGLYFDSRQPSGHELLAMRLEADAGLIARAKALRETLLARQITKYNVTGASPLPDAGGRRRVLVPGQVEGDASLRYGAPGISTNVALLAAARARHPDAFLVYKPHPDVLSGLRPGAVSASDVARLADAEIRDAGMAACLDWADHVETMTSLTGFEALLRGLSVSVHGQPFYAGWGLTEDLMPIPRRTRRLTVDELVAVTLILYPRYRDPVSRLPATPEVVVRRLAEMRDRPPTLAERAQRLWGSVIARLAHHFVSPIERLMARSRLEHPPIRLDQPDRKAAAQDIESGAISCRPDDPVRSESALGDGNPR